LGCSPTILVLPQPALFGYLHRSTRWAPRERRLGCLGMRSPDQRVRLIIRVASTNLGLMLIFWSTTHLSFAGRRQTRLVIGLSAACGRAVPGSDAPSPHGIRGVTTAQVPPEAARNHADAPLSREDVTIAKLRSHFAHH
jgi:hypothetical protein